ncbi:MAG: hypothetical protein PVH07_06905 [Chloroflexota bacterium]
MTHEYVIALNGIVAPGPAGGTATAVAWAAEAVLAVGTDESVRAISRGDSIFLDLDGCAITPLPANPEAAADAVRQAGTGAVDIVSLLVRAGRLDPEAALEPGAPADLAMWQATAGGGHRLVATVRGGLFTEGDDHRGPFPPPADP